jgi:hypothetical protein
VGAFFLVRFLRSLLFGISASDGPTTLVVVVTMTTVVVTATGRTRDWTRDGRSVVRAERGSSPNPHWRYRRDRSCDTVSQLHTSLASVTPRSDDCAKDGVTLELVSQTFASWNRMDRFVRQIEALRRAASH